LQKHLASLTDTLPPVQPPTPNPRLERVASVRFRSRAPSNSHCSNHPT
jgi:hypothetical protein